jgi:nucleoside-diphosphate-sugar epimerase
MTDFYKMAKKGKVYLFGDGKYQSNPIHGEDLAKVCVNAINRNEKETNVGGPEILTQEEIGKIAFDSLRKRSKIIYIPDWTRKLGLKVGKVLMSKYSYGPFEFFMHVMAMDMVGESYGNKNLYHYFKSLS